MEIDLDEAFRVSLAAAEECAMDAALHLKQARTTYQYRRVVTLNDNRQFVTPSERNYPALNAEPARQPLRKFVLHKGWALRTAILLSKRGERPVWRHFFLSESSDIMLMWENSYATHISTQSLETARLLVEDAIMAALACEMRSLT